MERLLKPRFSEECGVLCLSKAQDLLLPAEAGRFDGGLEDRQYFSLTESKTRHAAID
ncbi:MAG: hypothetical protein V1766_04285 [Pseudomonadota bacterium]